MQPPTVDCRGIYFRMGGDVARAIGIAVLIVLALLLLNAWVGAGPPPIGDAP